jgi:hypothetical protein
VRQTDEGQVWPADKNAAKDATPAEPRKKESATEEVLTPGDALASTAGPTQQPALSVTEKRSEPAPDTSGVDHLFARAARFLPPPQFLGTISLPGGTARAAPPVEAGISSVRDENGGTAEQSAPAPDESRPAALDATKLDRSDLTPLRTVLRRVCAAIGLLVLAPAACTLGRVTRRRRLSTEVRLRKRSAND